MKQMMTEESVQIEQPFEYPSISGEL